MTTDPNSEALKVTSPLERLESNALLSGTLESIEPELCDMVRHLRSARKLLKEAAGPISDALDCAMLLGEERPESEFYGGLIFEVGQNVNDDVRRYRETLTDIERRMRIMRTGLRG